jgi:LysR family glycine cleavage system transcriptional activator
MARLPLHTLPAFRTAARLSNLRAAAAALHLSHSAVSQQIRVLEVQLGFPVFERRGRRIQLNAAGKALLAGVETALASLDDALQAAAAAATGAGRMLRVTALPSFAQRWLLPRIGRWRARHPDIALEIDASQNLVDLQRDGFHAGVRTGPRGHWPGLESEPLIESPLIVVGSPAIARRLVGRGDAALANEALIGDVPGWQLWFAAAGLKTKARPVADFNDGGLMLQAAEHGLGITLAREMLAADALADGRLVRLSPVTIDVPDARGYYLVYPPSLKHWPPLVALRRWLFDELEEAQRQWVALRRTATGEPTRAATTRRQAGKPAARRVRKRTR